MNKAEIAACKEAKTVLELAGLYLDTDTTPKEYRERLYHAVQALMDVIRDTEETDET